MKRLKALTGHERVLLLTQERENATAVAALLADTPIELITCTSIDALGEQLATASAAIIGHDVLTGAPDSFHARVAADPALWSEFPFLVLVADDDVLRAEVDAFEDIQNMRCITLPLQGRELARALKSAIYDHHRHCTIRDHVAQLEEKTRLLARSQEVFHTMTNAMPAMVWMSDADKNGYYYNHARLAFTGRSLEEEQGSGWLDSVHPDDREACYASYAAHFDAREPFELVYRLRRHDGEYRYIIDRGAPHYDLHGAYNGYTGASIDIHDSVEAENLLRESEVRWKMLSEAMPQLVWMCRGSDGYCNYLNQQWEHYTGVGTGMLLGQRWLQLVHPQDRPMVVYEWSEAIAGRSAYDVEFRILRHDGVYRWFKARAVATRDVSGQIEAWYGTCTDIQDIVDARTRAEEANLAKTEFLANISHEIRTPMNAVTGLANILASSTPLTEKQQKYIGALQMSAGSLLSLINDMLDISKIEARAVELEALTFPIAALMDEVDGMMQPRAMEKGIRFAVAYGHGCARERRYVGDPARLRQVMLNLCSNAIKFTEEGEVRVDITAAAGEEGCELLTIAVRDTGMGIPVEKLPTIFDKFVQADATISRKFGGTGLGLAISRSLAVMMGGDITVESAPGEGSVFTFTLPLQLAHGGEVMPLSGARSRAEPVATMTARPRILLVEDYQANVLVATTFMEQFGYSYDIASNGREAVELVTQHRYAAILMDVQMQVMDGLEATAQIRAHEAAQGLPRVSIIGMTAHALSGDRERCLAAGMDDYISKPFDPDEFEHKLAAATSYGAVGATIITLQAANA